MWPIKILIPIGYDLEGVYVIDENVDYHDDNHDDEDDNKDGGDDNDNEEGRTVCEWN